MLELKNIKKTYKTGDDTVYALDDVSVSFRDSEFVAILGPSGSGKTTLLNIIGGLDRYDSGDLVINSLSTKKYGDKDWDSYRNHSVGFVFQNYNLIPHQSVLANVELALTLSGVSKSERRRRAKEVLEKVGLGDQLNKKPAQMSGGQMQRVAIARALINDPDILLADEPTGALDSKTSEQIMDLIRDISKNRLVIMVTHNPGIAEEYASRIININDGRISKDSDPYFAGRAEEKTPEEPAGKKKRKTKKTSMNFATALSLSFNNLLTKKGRTLITSFAGSIGIIGIALILSLSNGMQAYISSIERDTLASYPITIEAESFDLMQLMGTVGESDMNIAEHGADKIYKRPMLQNSVADLEFRMQQNDLGRFKKYIEQNASLFEPLCTDIKYGYDIDLQIFKSDTSRGVTRIRPNDALEKLGLASDTDVWEELIGDADLLESQYDILAGAWPKNYNEVVLFLDKDNEIDDLTLYALGLADVSELENAQNGASQNSEAAIELDSYEYSDFLNLSFRLVPSSAYYQKDGDVWTDMSEDEAYMKKVIAASQEIKIVAIARPKPNAKSTVKGGTVGYLSGLTEYAMNIADSSEIVKDQRANPDIDVFTGLRFDDTGDNAAVSPTSSRVSMPSVEFMSHTGNVPAATPVANTGDDYMTEDEIYAFIDENFEGEEKETFRDFVSLILKDIRSVSETKRLNSYLEKVLEGSDIDSTQFHAMLTVLNKDMKLQLLSVIIKAVQSEEQVDIPTEDELLGGTTNPDTNSNADSSSPGQEAEKFSDSTYEDNMYILGAADADTPASIELYPLNFESKERIVEIIDEYNAKQVSEGNKEATITYTDYVNLIMSSVTQVIDIVTYALIAFVAISLIVSSIMIGIITYISVLERTKEIGILRSIGASKKDISRVFNSETIIVGLTSGVIGILSTLVLIIPINAVVNSLAGIPKLAALPFFGGAALIVISVLLTLIAGFIPSRVAAKKDPVKALRSE